VDDLLEVVAELEHKASRKEDELNTAVTSLQKAQSQLNHRSRDHVSALSALKRDKERSIMEARAEADERVTNKLLESHERYTQETAMLRRQVNELQEEKDGLNKRIQELSLHQVP